MMTISFQRLVKGISVLGFIAVLTACGGGKGKAQSSAGQVVTSSSKIAVSNNSSSSLSSIASSLSETSTGSSLSSNSSSSRLPSVLIGGAVQGNPLNLSNDVSTFAGALPGGVDGLGTAARFDYPTHMLRVGSDIYIADSGANTIRKFVIATGKVTTIAGTPNVYGILDGVGAKAQFSSVRSITSDGTNLYVCDSNVIRKIVLASGEVTTLVGNPDVYTGSDGVGTEASFSNLAGIVFRNGNLYVTDSSQHTVRKILVETREVTTLAGMKNVHGNSDGVGSIARFYAPKGIAADDENLYIADLDNETIRKIVIATGAVSTFAGGGGIDSDGTGVTAGFHYPAALAIDEEYLYVTEGFANRVRKVSLTTSEVTTVAGSRLREGSNDGPGNEASFSSPLGITFDDNYLYISDVGNKTIRKISKATSAVSTVAGKNIYSCGNGPATDASFDSPHGIATDGENLYVADNQNRGIRKIVISTGEVSLVTGCEVYPDFYYPEDIAVSGGNLYVTDPVGNAIVKVDIATGDVTKFVGNYEGGAIDGVGESARFKNPNGITTDGNDLYVVDSSNYTIRKIDLTTKAVTTFAGKAGQSGNTDGIGAAARFEYPTNITTDGSSLYVLDAGSFTVRKIVIATGAVSTIAGVAGESDSTDGLGGQARFYSPTGITTDGTNLYVTDNQAVRKVSIATGEVSTLAGAIEASGGINGLGAAARFDEPYGITTDGFSLFVSDSDNNVIRKIQ